MDVFFAIVRMNPIFIYLFIKTAGKQWLVDFSGSFFAYALMKIGTGEHFALFINSVVVLSLAWGLCYWQYRKKIFIKT